MATTTTHYGFTKPGVNDYVDISVLNANFDNLDTVIYNNQLSAQAALDDIAPAYDATATYSVGDYVTYNKALYKCTTAITTAEAFDDTKWTAVKVGGELKSHDTRISDLEAGVELEGAATNSFDDGIDSYFKKVESSIVAVQAGTGTPSPTNERPITGFTECVVKDRGDNIFDIDAAHAQAFTYIYQYNITVEPNTAYICASDIPQTSPASIYFNGTSTDTDGVWNNNPKIVTSGADGSLYVLVRFSDAGGGIDAYTAIKNGTYTLTLAKVSTATIQFGAAGTVYSGRIEFISGKLVVDRGYFTPTSVYSVSLSGGGIYYWVISLPENTVSGSDGLISSHFKGDTAIQPGNTYTTGAGGRSLVAVPTDQSLNTKALADAWLQANNPQFVYKLATPHEYQLTPAQLRSLIGANRLTSSTGEVTEVEYIKNKTIAWLLDLIRA